MGIGTQLETVFCVLGHFQELRYNDDNLEILIDMVPCGNLVNVPAG